MNKLSGFDGMRAIACLAVLFHHLFQRLGIYSPLREYTDLGEMGVSLFFVLSGALLAFPFWKNYFSDKPFPNIKRYMINRAARIVPAFYLVIFISTCLTVLLTSPESPWLRMFAGMTFIAPYHYFTFFPNDMNGPLWSIGLEVSCYILLPLFLMFAWKMGPRHWLKPLIVVVSAIIFTQLINPFIVDTLMTDNINKGWEFGLSGGAKLWAPYWNVNSFMGQFLCGALASLIIVSLSNCNKGAIKYCFDIVALIGFGLAIFAINMRALNGQPWELTSFTLQPYNAPVFSLACTVILIGLSLGGVMHRIIDNWLFCKIATLSFGIYLWHVLIIDTIRYVWEPEFVINGIKDYNYWMMLSVIVVISSTLIAAVSYRFFEKPILDWAKNWQSKGDIKCALGQKKQSQFVIQHG